MPATCLPLPLPTRLPGYGIAHRGGGEYRLKWGAEQTHPTLFKGGDSGCATGHLPGPGQVTCHSMAQTFIHKMAIKQNLWDIVMKNKGTNCIKNYKQRLAHGKHSKMLAVYTFFRSLSSPHPCQTSLVMITGHLGTCFSDRNLVFWPTFSYLLWLIPPCCPTRGPRIINYIIQQYLTTISQSFDLCRALPWPDPPWANFMLTLTCSGVEVRAPL